MEAKELVCSDCGCRFELKDSKEVGQKPREKGEPVPVKTGPTDLWCPKCRSINVTTA